jgi:hypothetical protein
VAVHGKVGRKRVEAREETNDIRGECAPRDGTGTQRYHRSGTTFVGKHRTVQKGMKETGRPVSSVLGSGGSNTVENKMAGSIHRLCWEWDAASLATISPEAEVLLTISTL